MNFILKFFGLSSLGFIPNWGPRRMQPYEAATYRWLGIKPELHYVWSRRFQREKTNDVGRHIAAKTGNQRATGEDATW
jgi:hypothetical protein